jgi:hypothetical protein
VRIIARLLGVPESLAPELLAWSRDMVAMYQTGVTREVEDAAGRAAAEFTDFMRSYIDKRRNDPRDDLITELIAAEENGEKLSTDEMIANCILLLNAGHEATVHSLGNATRVLLEQNCVPMPDTADAIGEEDNTAVEEALAECKEVAEGEDTALIVDKVQVLSAALMKVGQAMYERAQADQDTGPASQADQADDDDVVDAEFEDVDDDSAA